MQTWAHSSLLLAIAASNLSLWPMHPPSPRPSPFVTRQGSDLVYQAQPFRFVGVNCFRLADRASSCDAILGSLAAQGVQVVRFWAFQTRCGPDGNDFTRFDAIVSAARRHGILLLPVLENHWGACTYGPETKPVEWYRDGWRTEKLGPLSYRDYVRAIGAHFRNEPQIMAWQLINEPEAYPDSKPNYQALRRFADQASHQLRAVDPNHLISLGLLGIGQPSTTGRRFRALHNTGSIGIVSAHDYGYINDPLPGQDWQKQENSLYADLCDARSLGKPFVATEAGIPISWVHGDRGRRAELFRAKLDAFFAAGGTGYILWNYEPVLETDCGIGRDDPALNLLHQFAGILTRENRVPIGDERGRVAER